MLAIFILCYQVMVGAGRAPCVLHVRLRRSPGDTETGGELMYGPEGIAEGGDIGNKSIMIYNDNLVFIPTTLRISAVDTVSKSGNSLLTSHRNTPPVSSVTGLSLTRPDPLTDF